MPCQIGRISNDMDNNAYGKTHHRRQKTDVMQSFIYYTQTTMHFGQNTHVQHGLIHGATHFVTSTLQLRSELGQQVVLAYTTPTDKSETRLSPTRSEVWKVTVVWERVLHNLYHHALRTPTQRATRRHRPPARCTKGIPRLRSFKAVFTCLICADLITPLWTPIHRIVNSTPALGHLHICKQ